MPNFLVGRKVGSKAVHFSGAPFLFTRFFPKLSFQRGVALQWRHYEVAVYPWPFDYGEDDGDGRDAV